MYSVPAEPVGLQLSFNVSAWSQVCVSAWSQVCVSAWSQVCVSAWSQVCVSAWSQVCVSAWSQVCVSAWSQVCVSAWSQVCIAAIGLGLHFRLHLLFLIVIRSHSRTCRCYLQVSVCCRQPQQLSPPPRELLHFSFIYFYRPTFFIFFILTAHHFIQIA
ncbi:hypothetical protein [Methanimicrococcus hongohii]|uniref:hypothetical protein n=1 Tax=Methanimicrococcus hongohii TaxID=3028295 RepID=UPI00292F2728|nr:hypothetical protein [Methanimicrococcus sp. Hf6]